MYDVDEMGNSGAIKKKIQIEILEMKITISEINNFFQGYYKQIECCRKKD